MSCPKKEAKSKKRLKTDNSLQYNENDLNTCTYCS